MTQLPDLTDLRVLLVKSKRLPRSVADITDGGSAHVFRLAAELSRRGAQVTAVVRAEPREATEAGPYHEVIELDTRRSTLSDILPRDAEDGERFVSAIPDGLLGEPGRVIHVHHWSSAMGLVERIPGDARVVFTPHLLAAEKADLLGVALPDAVREAEGAILRRADAIVFLSDAEAARAAREYGVSGPGVAVIPNGVGLGVLPPARDPDGLVRLTSIGRLARQKGYDVLLDALELVAPDVAERLDVRLYGPGYDEPAHEGALREQAARSPVRVRFEGPVPHDRVAEVLAHSDIYVQPSRYESQGIAIQEAMSAGLPVIATRLQAVTEYATDGREAVLVPVDDAPALALAIESLVRDDDERRRIGRAAASAPALQTWDASVTASIDVLRAVHHRDDPSPSRPTRPEELS